MEKEDAQYYAALVLAFHFLSMLDYIHDAVDLSDDLFRRSELTLHRSDSLASYVLDELSEQDPRILSQVANTDNVLAMMELLQVGAGLLSPLIASDLAIYYLATSAILHILLELQASMPASRSKDGPQDTVTRSVLYNDAVHWLQNEIAFVEEQADLSADEAAKLNRVRDKISEQLVSEWREEGRLLAEKLSGK